MKRLAAMAMVLCATRVALGWPASTPQTPHPAIVRIMSPERNGASFGSGTLVAATETHGLVVTNWHVVSDAAGPIIVTFPDGFQSGAVVLKTDRTWDLAALAIWRPKVQPVALAAAAPRPGEPLTIAGYGKGAYRAAPGQCTQYVSPGANQPFEMVEVSSAARQGDSGGPILNGQGELAGVLFGSGFGRTAGSYCGRVRSFLNSTWNDFQHLPANSTLIAQQPPSAERPPVASIAGVRAVGAPESRPDSASAGEPSARRVPAVPSPSAVANARPGAVPPSGPAPPQGQVAASPPCAIVPAGPSRLDDIKTGLAVVGALALLFHGLRLLSQLQS